MDIANIRDEAWQAALESGRSYQFKFPASGLIVMNLRWKLRSDRSALPECIRELREFFQSYSDLPPVHDDLELLLGGGK